ncbi:MAG: hypothetical protein ACI8PZ_007240 [Myxococcota bacterium]|jgi:hypothetical protein
MLKPTILVSMFLFPAAAIAVPTLSVEGECPGLATVTVADVTPGASVTFLLSGVGEGANVVPGGACAGAVTGLAGPRRMFSVPDSDGDGVITYSPDLPDGACSKWVQVMDGDSCGFSNVVDMSTVGAVGCVPSGARAAFDTLNVDTAGGCWSDNPCSRDAYGWDGIGQNFTAFGEQISCTGAPTCVANVGITTYAGSDTVCQGAFDVLCDGAWVGMINTLGSICDGNATSNGCQTTFDALTCSEITLEAIDDGDLTSGCCGSPQPDSMVTAVSAW